MSIYSKLNSLLTAANTKTGESDTTLTDAVQTLIDGYGQGGGGDPDKWVRPSNYPDLDNIVLPNFICTYLTYDLSKVISPEDKYISTYYRGDSLGNLIAERGHLNSNNEFVADETYQGSEYWGNWTFFKTLDEQDGTVQLWRLRQTAESKQPQFNFYTDTRTASGEGRVQPCVEVLHNEPPGTKFATYGSSQLGATVHTQSVKIIGGNSTMSAYSAWSNATSLKRLIIDTEDGVFSDARNLINQCVKLKELDFGGAVFPQGNGGFGISNCASLRTLTFPTCNKTGSPSNVVGGCVGLENLDLRNLDVSGVTSLPNGFFQNLYSLKELNMDGLDFISDTNTSAYNNVQYIPNIEEFYPPIIYRSQVWNQPTLTHASLVRLMNALPATETAKTVTIGSYNQSKLTAAEIAIATGKGWTVA